MTFFSIVIPTGGRPNTIWSSTMSALAFDVSDLEVVVSDNDHSGQTFSLLSNLKDDRFRLVRTPHRLSMTDHFNFAVQHARGKYILFLGDDDGLVPGLADIVKNALITTEADIATAEQHVYLWPTANRAGGIWHLATPYAQSIVSLPARAKRSLRLGGARWERAPSIYRSFIHRRALQRIQDRIGQITRTMIPDMYMGFALAGLDTRCVDVGFPFAIGGMSYMPRTLPKISLEHQEYDESLSNHVREHAGIMLSSRLPSEFPAIVNAFADSIISATSDFSDHLDGRTLNMSAHYAWLASWAKIGTPLEFWRIRARLSELGFSFLEFFLYYTAFRVQHTISSRKASRLAKMISARDIVEASYLIKNSLFDI